MSRPQSWRKKNVKVPEMKIKVEISQMKFINLQMNNNSSENGATISWHNHFLAKKSGHFKKNAHFFVIRSNLLFNS